MKTAIRDDNPVVIFNDKMMYNDKAEVPDGELLIPFGVANVLREGTDITLVGTSSMVGVCATAAEMLEDDRHQCRSHPTRARLFHWMRRRL